MTTPWHYAQIQNRRDETFEHIRRVFRWTVAGAIAGTAVIVGVVAHEIPGRASAATTSNNGSGTPATAPPAVGGAAGNTDGGLPSAPVTAPAPTQRAPAVVSGGTGW